MATTNKLSALKVTRSKPGTVIGDGGGLYLRTDDKANRTWLFRYTLRGKARQMGFGSARDVPLALAREMAAEARKLLATGIDPLEQREAEERARAVAEARAVTWKAAVEAYLASHRASWRSDKNAEQWRITLESTYPLLGNVPVAQIDAPMIVKALAPIWNVKPITASRLRGRIENVLDYARVMKWRDGPNPATWRGNLKEIFPKPTKLRPKRHLPAIPFDRVPELMQTLAQQRGTAAKALRFTVMVAARSNEARGATWDEFDLDAAIPCWCIGADRMKAAKPHRVPLAPAVVDLLREIQPEKPKAGQLVFANRRGRALSDMALPMQLRSAGFGECSVHGARSAFKDWARRRTNFRDELSELALAHTVGNDVRNAYARDDLLEERAPLMKAWAQHCTRPPQQAQIVSLVTA